MKKKFPKAVLRTAAEMRGAGIGSGMDTIQRREALHTTGANEPQNIRAQANAAGLPHNVIEMVPKMENVMSATAASQSNSKPSAADADAIRRRRLARAIVERHANYSAIGGAIPLPIANIASITAIIVRMVKALSDLYGVPFQRNRARAIVIGLMGGIMPAGIATVATSTLIYFVPGYNLVGLAVSSVTSSAAARSIGDIFIDHFENGSTLVDFPSAILR